jgi:hypothetical protein
MLNFTDEQIAKIKAGLNDADFKKFKREYKKAFRSMSFDCILMPIIKQILA